MGWIFKFIDFLFGPEPQEGEGKNGRWTTEELKRYGVF